MRRAFAAFLILSLFGGQVGMFGALIGRYHARQRMRRRMSAASESPGHLTDVQHLTLSQADWQSPNSSFTPVEEEFWYQGNLYDVVSQEWRGDVLHVWVLRDREEEQYLDALAQSITTPMLEGASGPAHPRLVRYRPLALAPAAWAAIPSPNVHAQSYPRRSSVDHQAPYLAVPHPPPWG